MASIAVASAIMFALIIIFFGMVPHFIIPMVYGEYSGGVLSKDWFAQFIDVPTEVVAWPNVIWYTAFPLMATIAIVYGFMEELQIFRHAANSGTVYIVIAVAWSFLLIRSGILGKIGRLMYGVGTVVAIVVFVIVFVIGAIMSGIGSARRRF